MRGHRGWLSLLLRVRPDFHTKSIILTAPILMALMLMVIVTGKVIILLTVTKLG